MGSQMSHEDSWAREITTATSELRRVPVGGDPLQILGGIPSRLGIAAGLLGVFEAGAPLAMRNRSLGLPPEILHG